jgi:hypothetical protein
MGRQGLISLCHTHNSQLPSQSCQMYRLPLYRPGRFTRNILRSTAIQKSRQKNWEIYPKKYLFGGPSLPKYESDSERPASLERPRPAHHSYAFKNKIIFQISMELVVKVAIWSLFAKFAQVFRIFFLLEKKLFLANRSDHW